MACAGCNKLMVQGAVITALNKKYHEKCFVCQMCRNPLDGPFYGCQDEPFCENCIDEAESRAAKGTLNVGASKPSAAASGNSAPVAAAPSSPDLPPKPTASIPVDISPAQVQSEERCFKCKRPITSGTVINALNHHFCETCFVCAWPSCGTDLDTFYGCDGLPYCPDHIDAAEDRAAAGIPSAPASTSSYSSSSSYGGSVPPPAAVDEPIPIAVSAKPKVVKTLPPGSTWEQEAAKAEDRAELLEEKLSHIKLALLEERKSSQEQYSELEERMLAAERRLAAINLELQSEKSRNARLEAQLRDYEARGVSGGGGGGGDDSARLSQLQRECDNWRSRCEEAERRAASASLSMGLGDSSRAEELERQLQSALERAERAEAAAAAAAYAAPAPPSFDFAGGGGAPPPPPPPPGAPPPPPPPASLGGGPLKITRTGQSNRVPDEAAAPEHNPQADLISELKKGRPQLRRTAASRPSKRDILTRNANARAAEEDSRPDPSLVKGADTGNQYARTMAGNAEKSAGLAQEREQRVNKGELRMKVHRNKYLDTLLDQIK